MEKLTNCRTPVAHACTVVLGMSSYLYLTVAFIQMLKVHTTILDSYAIHTGFTRDSHGIHTGFTRDSHGIHTGFIHDS
eukprot:1369127-Amorphochlora_amoeboformis.AAC.1